MELWQMRIKHKAIHERVRVGLDYLTNGGENPGHVWAMLALNEIIGCGQQTCCCPIARFLQANEPFGIVHVYDDHYRVHTEWGSLVAGPIPYAVREFIRMFDDGRYPLLVDYKHRHSHPPIPTVG